MTKLLKNERLNLSCWYKIMRKIQWWMRSPSHLSMSNWFPSHTKTNHLAPFYKCQLKFPSCHNLSLIRGAGHSIFSVGWWLGMVFMQPGLVKPYFQFHLICFLYLFPTHPYHSISLRFRMGCHVCYGYHSYCPYWLLSHCVKLSNFVL